MLLVDVNADAEDARFQHVVGNRCLNERPADFAVIPINVVGPFECDAVSVAVERTFQGKRASHRQDELLGGRNHRWSYPQGEEQVLPSFALPRVGALSPSGSLIVSRDSYKIIVSRQLAQVAIGGIGLFKVYDIPFHVCPQNAFSMWLMTTSASEVPTTVTISKRKSALMRNCFT